MIIDAEVEQLSGDQIAQQARRADFIGITTAALTYNSALEIARLTKQSNVGTMLVLGGPQATFLGAESLEKSPADAVVCGKGEHTMLDVANAVESGSAFYFDGVTYRDAASSSRILIGS